MTQPIDVVNAYRELTGLAAPFNRSERAAQRFIDWCSRHDVPPIPFMRARLWLAREHSSPPVPLSQMAAKGLLGDAWVEILDRAERSAQDGKMQRRELALSRARDLATLAACTPAQEKFKAQHQQRELCMHLMEHSGGYHPKSQFCPTCPVNQVCAPRTDQTFGFGVVAWREQHGHIGYVRIE